MNSTKAAQRKQLLKIRDELTSGEVKESSEIICGKLYSLQDWQATKKVHCYLPIETKREVSTWPLINKLWANNSNVKVYTSIYGTNKALQHVLINEFTEFEKDGLGIPLPTTNYTQETAVYDLIVLPVLGFDEKLNRLGYGRGVYDTFLASQPDAKTVGLAYQESKLTIVENEPHDERLDQVITEVHLYN